MDSITDGIGDVQCCVLTGATEGARVSKLESNSCVFYEPINKEALTFIDIQLLLRMFCQAVSMIIRHKLLSYVHEFMIGFISWSCAHSCSPPSSFSTTRVTSCPNTCRDCASNSTPGLEWRVYWFLLWRRPDDSPIEKLYNFDQLLVLLCHPAEHTNLSYSLFHDFITFFHLKRIWNQHLTNEGRVGLKSILLTSFF